MTSPYRTETDALRERIEQLQRELSDLKAHTSQLEGLRARERELEQELTSATTRLGASTRRALPMLDQVKVASPCHADWNEMIGDDRVRFCKSCEKNVFNLSAMPREDAERLLLERANGEMCIRFYQRADGTVMTEDCPVGMKKKMRKRLAIAVAGAGAMAFAATTAFMRGPNCTTGGAVMGEMAAMDLPMPPPPQPQAENHDPPPPPVAPTTTAPVVVMGQMPVAAPPPRHVTGMRAR